MWQQRYLGWIPRTGQDTGGTVVSGQGLGHFLRPGLGANDMAQKEEQSPLGLEAKVTQTENKASGRQLVQMNLGRQKSPWFCFCFLLLSSWQMSELA